MHTCVYGAAPAGAGVSVGERGGWWEEKERAGSQGPGTLNTPSGNASDIFQPLVSGQSGIYGSAVSHDDLGGAELRVTSD